MDTTAQNGSVPDDLLTPREAAALAKCSLATLYRYLAAGLRTWKRGGRRFVSRADVLGLFRPVQPHGPA
jgi:hypothetical protein